MIFVSVVIYILYLSSNFLFHFVRSYLSLCFTSRNLLSAGYFWFQGVVSSQYYPYLDNADRYFCKPAQNPSIIKEGDSNVCDNPCNSSDGDGFIELEQILRQKTFTRQVIVSSMFLFFCIRY